MSNKEISRFIEEVTGKDHFRIDSDLGNGFYRLKSEEAQRRQALQDIRCSEDILRELLRNARDAHAKNIYIALSKSNEWRRILVIDDGEGIPKDFHKIIFEPCVTSKLDNAHFDNWGLHGRGMALYSIAQNSSKAFVQASLPDRGSSFFVETNTLQLPEKKDQSTYPHFAINSDGSASMRGPKNLLRIASEFAIDSRDSLNIYLGSATEIAASLYNQANSRIAINQRIFSKTNDELCLCDRLCTVSDPSAFSEMSNLLGLTLSERSARRILDGSIAPLPTMLEILSTQLNCALQLATPKTCPKKNKRAASARKIKLLEKDRRILSDTVKDGFGKIASSYYLLTSIEPEIKCRKDAIHIKIPLIATDEDN